jgi:hypothetical protein
MEYEYQYEYLMNIASVLFIACYIPELYANYKNKNANFWNVPEKVVIFVGTSFAFSYAALNNDRALMINYGPILGLDTIAMLMRAYYAYQNHRKTKNMEQIVDDPKTNTNTT